MMPGGDQSGQKVGIMGSQRRHVEIFDSIRFDFVRIVSVVLSCESPEIGCCWRGVVHVHRGPRECDRKQAWKEAKINVIDMHTLEMRRLV